MNIQGSTIHRFFGYPSVDLFPKNAKYAVPRNSLSILENAKVICIDEISMVRSDLMDAIDRSLRSCGDKDRPFGGKNLLLVGDLYQLPPIVKKDTQDVFRNYNPSADPANSWASEWFLDADVFRQVGIKRIDLTHVFRQQDQTFINLLNGIRTYNNIQGNLEKLNSLVKIGSAAPEGNSVYLTFTNNVADRINAEKI